MDEDKRRMEKAFWQLGRELDVFKRDRRSTTAFPFAQLEQLIGWLLDHLSQGVEIQVSRFLTKLSHHPWVQHWRERNTGRHR